MVLKEGFYYDDYSHDTINANTILIADIDLLSPPFNMAVIGNYTLTHSGTLTTTAIWNSLTNTLDINSGDNDGICQVYANTNLPNSGYLRLKFHISHSYPSDIMIRMRIRQDDTNYYKANIYGNSYDSEYISKYVGGVETDASSPHRTGTIETIGNVFSSSIGTDEDVDVEIEFWWSPIYLKLMIDSANEIELNCTNDISELDIANIYIDWFQGDYEVDEMVVSYYTPKIGVGQLINSKSFNEVGPIDDLIGYWSMNGHLKDYSEDNNDGTAIGATINHTAPRDRMCYDFTNSTADKIDLINTIACLEGIGWSWSFWGYKTIFGHDGWACNQDLYANGMITFNSSTVSTIYTNAPTNNYQVVTTISFPTSEWFNCIITHTPSNVYTIYLNGTQAGQSNALAGNIFVNRIGDNPNNSAWTSFDGLMFDFRIYNKVLSTNEINILSNMFDTDGATVTNMSLSKDGSWYVFGEFKE